MEVFQPVLGVIRAIRGYAIVLQDARQCFDSSGEDLGGGAPKKVGAACVLGRAD